MILKQLVALILLLPLYSFYGFAVEVQRIDAIDLVVNDMPRLEKFYIDTLDCKKVLDTAFGNMQIVTLQLGEGKINLIRYLDAEGRSYPPNYQANDRFFQSVAIRVSDMYKAYGKLSLQGVQGISTSPQRLPSWNVTLGGIISYYFKDPEGHPLELIFYPPGKNWQKLATGPLFIGIDSTSLVVYDTQKSVNFYQNEFGLSQVDSSESYGQEQAELSNVSGAHIRLTTLKAKSGIPLKLIQYLYPTGGKPMPLDTVFNDLWRTTVHLGVNNLNKPAYLLQDPDGHVYLLTGVASATSS